jgi:glutamate synthase domain-containing protein 2
MRKQFVQLVLISLGLTFLLGLVWPGIYYFWIVLGPLVLVGFYDYFQRSHSVRRNFPIIGHFRYMLEAIRPEIYQYFIESNSDGRPFSREMRSIVYQRAKQQLDTQPFGTQKNVYEVGYEWINHSMHPVEIKPQDLRLTIGNEQCAKPYSASIFNIGAMSYGALSKNAIMALNGGAKLGNFAHNTGEGGLSPYHLTYQGDLIWQIGTAYFSCREPDGRFSLERYRETVAHPEIKMVELKISQGAKPGYGGILPAAKITKEIAEIRGVPIGQDIVSPSGHSTFHTPTQLMEFLQKLREESGGKPVGFKFVVGKRHEFFAVCKAIHKTGIIPDFISLDGGEGGTGAAPLEFANYVGSPLREALIFVHNALVGFNLREKVRVLVSGKILTGYEIVKYLAIGADACYSSRGMMFALGCIQALRCNSNHCPVGVATQNPNLVAGLDVTSKIARVNNFHRETVESVSAIVGSMGLSSHRELRPYHITRRTSLDEVRTYSEIFRYIGRGTLLGQPVPEEFERPWRASSAETFDRVD